MLALSTRTARFVKVWAYTLELCHLSLTVFGALIKERHRLITETELMWFNMPWHCMTVVVDLPYRKDQIAAQREYKKKKNEKKRLRVKQLEEQKEKEKHQWLSFNAKVYPPRSPTLGYLTKHDMFLF